MSEFALIEQIGKTYGSESGEIVRGIGDDAAALEVSNDYLLLATTDMLVEGIHFDLQYTSPYDLGKKAIAVNISDIAAMGGSPAWSLISIGLPENTSGEFVEQFYAGISEHSRSFGVKLIGGDTVASKKGIVISIHLFGKVPKEEMILRSGAKVGDRIFVTGTLGDSAAGLEVLRLGQNSETKRTEYDSVVKKHLSPSPRVDEARYLAKEQIATSMMDISDGIVQDLGHICAKSNVHGKLWFDKIPLSTGYKFASNTLALDAALPLCGGEDYELLFTLPPEKIEQLDLIIDNFSCDVTEVGEILQGEGVSACKADGSYIEVDRGGYDHFKKSV